MAARPALGDNRVLNDLDASLGAFRRLGFARSLELRAFRTHAHTRTPSENCSRKAKGDMVSTVAVQQMMMLMCP